MAADPAPLLPLNPPQGPLSSASPNPMQDLSMGYVQPSLRKPGGRALIKVGICRVYIIQVDAVHKRP